MGNNTQKFTENILRELSFRIDDGIPNLSREADIQHIYNILVEWGVPYSEVYPFIQNLTEADDDGIELSKSARSMIDSKGLTHMGYGYWGKNDEVMFKKNDKGELVATTDDEYKDDVEKKQKAAGNVDGKPTPKKKKTTQPDSESEETETPPPSAFTGDALKSLQADLPDNDPLKKTIKNENFNIDDIVNEIIESYLTDDTINSKLNTSGLLSEESISELPIDSVKKSLGT
jgi:hypothetical protein